MSEFIISGKKLQDLIVPPRYRELVNVKEPIKGTMVVEGTLVYFLPCEFNETFFTTAIESEIKKKKVFYSNQFNKVFKLDPNYEYRIVLEEGSMTIYFNKGRLLFDLVGILL